MFGLSMLPVAAVLCLIPKVFAVAPSDTWRDADIGQSSYVGANHNMDPAVVDSSQFGLLWKVPMNDKEQVMPPTNVLHKA